MTGTHWAFTFAFAGTCFFMLGMSMASENLQKLSANRIRDLIGKLSSRPLLGLGSGILVTLLMQSSGAVTSMLVGLGSAGVVTLQQVMSILLGASIGTTLTVQLLSLNIAQFGLGIFSVAILSNKWQHKNAIKMPKNIIVKDVTSDVAKKVIIKFI